MRKNLLAGAFLVMSAGLAACGNSSQPAATEAATTTAAQETTTAPVTEAPTTQAAPEATVVTGEAEGYGGPVTAEITLEGDKITDLKLTGDQETPGIGGAALETLQAAIIEKGGLDGVDAVAGATWTSNAVFDAVRSALGIESEEAEGNVQKEVAAAGLSHGIGFASNGRLGPGKDDQEVGVYSFNEVIAYVLFDDEGRILDLEVDQLEVATPNYDGEHMPHLTGFPGQSYNADEDHDEKVDTVLEQTDDTFLAEVDSWTTKRERGDTYKLNSGTWTDEMELFEETFRGMTMDEVNQWYAAYCSDLNGKPLHGTSDKDEDIKKYEALSDEEKVALDAISGATMSLNDGHGNIMAAIQKAYDQRRPVGADSVAKIGLGITNTGRLGPGKDDQETGVYSFNTQAAGACYDEDGKIIALFTDVMEIATPNYDGEHMPHLTGFPGQSYNADEDHDEKVDTVLEQTDDTFLAEVDSWATKRERGNTYKLNSGTWADEMNIFEEFFAGKTTDEVTAWYETACSDLNGRPLHGTSDKDEDVKKYEALTDQQKEELDGISGATMSLRDAHGDLLGAIEKAWAAAKDTNITIE